jgi:hypothetical protein
VAIERAVIEAGLAVRLDARLVSEMLDAHAEAKRSFYLGGHRLAEVEGGRFCEAALRLLEQIAFNAFTPLGNQLDSERAMNRLKNVAAGAQPDSVRLHIPRALRLVYDIRNNRDAAHLADGIDPNLQDSTLVMGVVDWVVAEFVRMYHSVPADAAQRIVEELVTRAAPVVQDFDGQLKVLSPKLSAPEHALVLLYQRGQAGATLEELSRWVRPKMRADLRRTLYRLEHERDLVHSDGSVLRITMLGQREVERKRLVSP